VVVLLLVVVVGSGMCICQQAVETSPVCVCVWRVGNPLDQRVPSCCRPFINLLQVLFSLLYDLHEELVIG
jgi:hypothetical protein